MRRTFAHFAILTLLALITGQAARAQPKAGPTLPNRVLQPVFDKYVRPDGVDYARLKADKHARASLARFTAAAAKMPPQAPLADWLNLYNALVIQQIVERYPIKRVMDVQGFFKALTHPIAGQPRTLDQLEHDIIRKRFKDARVHAALNCGAASCPKLSQKLFEPATTDAQLDARARAMVADDAHVRVRGQALQVSAIFFWFADDFRRDAGSVRAWLDRYAPGGKLATVPADAKLVEMPYDWSLNRSR